MPPAPHPKHAPPLPEPNPRHPAHAFQIVGEVRARVADARTNGDGRVFHDDMPVLGDSLSQVQLGITVMLFVPAALTVFVFTTALVAWVGLGITIAMGALWLALSRPALHRWRRRCFHSTLGLAASLYDPLVDYEDFDEDEDDDDPDNEPGHEDGLEMHFEIALVSFQERDLENPMDLLAAARAAREHAREGFDHPFHRAVQGWVEHATQNRPFLPVPPEIVGGRERLWATALTLDAVHPQHGADQPRLRWVLADPEAQHSGYTMTCNPFLVGPIATEFLRRAESLDGGAS